MVVFSTEAPVTIVLQTGDTAAHMRATVDMPPLTEIVATLAAGADAMISEIFCHNTRLAIRIEN